jgi:predicted flap endonuclease-1-like 5' DNA nuclease
MLAESVLDLDLKDVDGIGPKTRDNLVEGDIESVLDLAAALPKELESVLWGNVEARGQIVQLRDDLCFFPEQVSVVD